MMNYPYANGAIHALDETIMDRSKLAKLIKMSPDDILKTLKDVGYGEVTSTSIEEIIADEQNKVKQLLASISPEKKLTDLFFLAYDALNFKTYYKQKIFSVPSSAWSQLGNFDPNQFSDLIDPEKDMEQSKESQRLFRQLEAALLGMDNPRLVSATVDRVVFSFLFSQTKNVVLITYFQTLIDTINLKTLLRSQQLQWKEVKLQEMILDHGTISKEAWMMWYPLEKEALIKAVYSAHEVLSKGIKLYYEKHNINELESYLDEVVLHSVAPFRHDSFGIGPIVYYFLKKQMEAKNIRLIYGGEANDPSDLLGY